jgi:hypothetical protein
MFSVNKVFGVSILLLFFVASTVKADNSKENIKIENNKVSFILSINNARLQSETFSLKKSWAKKNYGKAFSITSTANFSLDIFWTYWNAPGKTDNSDLQLSLDKNSFKVTDKFSKLRNDGSQIISVKLKSAEYNFIVKIEYLLLKDAYIIKKKITVYDSEYETHFLQKIHTYNSSFSGIASIIKPGGYGQPAAFSTINKGGGFVGVEYPTTTNQIAKEGDSFRINTIETIAKKITSQGVEGSWSTLGLTPRTNVKFWFMKYLDNVRVAKLRPYTLYNSWYDLRSVDYPKVPSKYWMNEKNVNRIISEIKKNFIDDHGINIDAFVLDDGWDIYASDWKLRTKQFPNGMEPISKKLKQIGSTLGLWFGPTGGYSFRLKRINWMRKHGYEVVGTKGEWQPMLCIAGKNYKKLFTKRVTDFVKNDGVGYYKWDGIQFSCSEPDHGHPIGEYSRRAVMESVASICDTVRKLNPNIFLNITSGTWLSPWWIKFANTIWMQGGDYGYSDVPSISRRDRAITYRDITLYNDFTKFDKWFPISNLMTHGIIKGKLQLLGKSEPLDKFTDNAVLYFARGVAMYEFYISPDILSPDEWNALAKSLKWGKANFNILMQTDMVGGDPSKAETYGYTHFKGDSAIVALRNPKISSDSISFVLSDKNGMNKNASNLVLEQIYPRNIISPKLYKTGDRIRVNLSGFETAIYRLYPLENSSKPLITNVDYVDVSSNEYKLHPVNENISILNPQKITQIKYDGKLIDQSRLISKLRTIKTQDASSFKLTVNDNKHYQIKYNLGKKIKSAQLGLLIKPGASSETQSLPTLNYFINNKNTKVTSETEKNKWRWDIVNLTSTEGKVKITAKDSSNFNGTIEIYLFSFEKQSPKMFTIDTKEKFTEILPPRPNGKNIIKTTRKIGIITLQ